MLVLFAGVNCAAGSMVCVGERGGGWCIGSQGHCVYVSPSSGRFKESSKSEGLGLVQAFWPDASRPTDQAEEKEKERK
jgi:hypothetical protein